jgi:hypothetical protein
MSVFNELLAIQPTKTKAENGDKLNNTEKRKQGVENAVNALQSIAENLDGISEDLQVAISQAKKMTSQNSIKSYQQLKLFSNDFTSVYGDFVEMAKYFANLDETNQEMAKIAFLKAII